MTPRAAELPASASASANGMAALPNASKRGAARLSGTSDLQGSIRRRMAGVERCCTSTPAFAPAVTLAVSGSGTRADRELLLRPDPVFPGDPRAVGSGSASSGSSKAGSDIVKPGSRLQRRGQQRHRLCWAALSHLRGCSPRRGAEKLRTPRDPGTRQPRAAGRARDLPGGGTGTRKVPRGTPFSRQRPLPRLAGKSSALCGQCYRTHRWRKIK